MATAPPEAAPVAVIAPRTDVDVSAQTMAVPPMPFAPVAETSMLLAVSIVVVLALASSAAP